MFVFFFVFYDTWLQKTEVARKTLCFTSKRIIICKRREFSCIKLRHCFVFSYYQDRLPLMLNECLPYLEKRQKESSDFTYEVSICDFFKRIIVFTKICYIVLLSQIYYSTS